MPHNIALSHASGIAAQAILEKLPESAVAPDSLVLLDEEANIGKRIAYAGSHRKLLDQHQYDLSECAALLMPQADPTLEAQALQQGCLVISHAVDDPAAPIFFGSSVAEPDIAYNTSRLRLAGEELCCLLPVLRELDRMTPITSLHLTLFRSVEFRGKAGIDELAGQTVNLLNSREVDCGVYPQQIAFNLIPEATSPRLDTDFRQYLANSPCHLALQTVNVPLFHGFAAAVQLGFAGTVDAQACRQSLANLEDVTVSDSAVTPISDCNQSFGCAISHLQQGSNQARDLQFWLVADPMRYGLANNYVNVVDFLLKSFL